MAAKPDCWLLGDPAYVRNNGEWEFFSREPTPIEEYIDYRDKMLFDCTVSIEAIELISDIIDSAIVVRRAMRKMKNASI